MSNIRAVTALKQKPQGASAGLVRKHLNKSFSIQAIISGTPTEAAVKVSGSLDNIHFKELATHTFSAEELVDEHALFHIVNKPVGTIQLTVETLTGGTSPTMTVYVMEGE